MKRVQQGFTLIELMIVVAIIGILAAVAIPQYKNYTIKARIGNALSSVDSIKTAVALCLQENGGTLTSCDALGENGIPTTFTPTKEVTGVTMTASTAAIVATLDASVGVGSGKHITWTPNTGTGAGDTALTWQITTDLTTTDVSQTVIDSITKNSVAAGT
jgi:type IV pilus assembly protein PilA